MYVINSRQELASQYCSAARPTGLHVLRQRQVDRHHRGGRIFALVRWVDEYYFANECGGRELEQLTGGERWTRESCRGLPW